MVEVLPGSMEQLSSVLFCLPVFKYPILLCVIACYKKKTFTDVSDQSL